MRAGTAADLVWRTRPNPMMPVSGIHNLRMRSIKRSYASGCMNSVKSGKLPRLASMWVRYVCTESGARLWQRASTLM